MQRLASIAVVAVALAAWAAGARAADDPPGVARVGLVEGQASYRLRDSDEWTGVAVNAPLVSGDQFFSAAGSRAEIQLASGTYARLGAETQLDLVELAGDATQVAVPFGRMILRLRENPTERHVEVDTPSVALVLTRAGSYRVDVEMGGRTTVRIGRGEAVAYVGDQRFEVYADASAVIDSSLGDAAFRSVAYSEDDDFDRWERARDARVDASQSYQHVSTDIYGAEDLDDNGVWEYRSGYGALWRPTSVVAGWAPYRDGRWVWVEPWGWTWLDDAAWGWAPFHYGRWVWLDGSWYWGPGAVVARPVYAPALVAFYGPGLGGVSISVGFGSGYIGWVPLGWGEPCYPWWGGFGGARVGYAWWGGWGGPRVFHRGRHGGRAYANRRHPGGFTAVRRGDFARGGRVVPVGGRTRGSWRAVGGRVGISPERNARRAVDPSRRTVGRQGPPPAGSARRAMMRARGGDGGGRIRARAGDGRGGGARTGVVSRPPVHSTTTRAPSAPRRFARRSEPYVAQRPGFHSRSPLTGTSGSRSPLTGASGSRSPLTGASGSRSPLTGASGSHTAGSAGRPGVTGARRRTEATAGRAFGAGTPSARVTAPSRTRASRVSYRRSTRVERSRPAAAAPSPRSVAQASPPTSRRTAASSGAPRGTSSHGGARSWPGRVSSQPSRSRASATGPSVGGSRGAARGGVAPGARRSGSGFASRLRSPGSGFTSRLRGSGGGFTSRLRASRAGGFGGGGRASPGGGRLGVGHR